MKTHEAEFEKAYSKHFAYIKNVCLRIVKDESVAEDVAQDAFVNAWRKLHQFNGSSKMTTWLHRIAINQSLMFLRGQPRIERLQLEDPALQSLRARGMHPLYTIALNRAIDRLPEGYKAMVLLRDYYGFDCAEVAAIRRCSEGNVKSQTSKGRQQARRLLEVNLPEHEEQ